MDNIIDLNSKNKNIPIFGEKGFILKNTDPSQVSIENMLAWTLDPKAEGELDANYIIGVLLYELNRTKSHLIKSMNSINFLDERIKILESK